MKRLTATELKNLEYGQKVTRFYEDESQSFRFVGIMPSNKNYLIFEAGESLTHLYISPRDNAFRYDWYIGEYDSEFIGNLKIAYFEKRIETIKKIHFN